MSRTVRFWALFGRGFINRNPALDASGRQVSGLRVIRQSQDGLWSVLRRARNFVDHDDLDRRFC